MSGLRDKKQSSLFVCSQEVIFDLQSVWIHPAVLTNDQKMVLYLDYE